MYWINSALLIVKSRVVMVFEIGSEIRNGLVRVRMRSGKFNDISFSNFNKRELQENQEIKSLIQLEIESWIMSISEPGWKKV